MDKYLDNLSDNPADDELNSNGVKCMMMLFGLCTASSIPEALIGTFLSFVNEQSNNNASLLLENLESRLAKLEETFRRSILSDQEKYEKCCNLIHYGLIKTRICHRKEQVYRLADIILDSVEHGLTNEEDAEVLIDIVSELNYKEATCFGKICDLIKEGVHHFVDNRILDLYYINPSEDKKSENLAILKRLEAKGLLHNRSMNIEVSAINDDLSYSEDDLHSEFSYILSDYGDALARIVYNIAK